jgi:hypothetical protein
MYYKVKWKYAKTVTCFYSLWAHILSFSVNYKALVAELFVFKVPELVHLSKLWKYVFNLLIFHFFNSAIFHGYNMPTRHLYITHERLLHWTVCCIPCLMLQSGSYYRSTIIRCQGNISEFYYNLGHQVFMLSHNSKLAFLVESKPLPISRLLECH